MIDIWTVFSLTVQSLWQQTCFDTSAYLTLRELIFVGTNFRGFSAKSRKFKPAKYNFCQFYQKNWKIPRKMKEIWPKKGKTAKINSREMRFFRIFFRPRKLVPAKISSLKVMPSIKSYWFDSYKVGAYNKNEYAHFFCHLLFTL